MTTYRISPSLGKWRIGAPGLAHPSNVTGTHYVRPNMECIAHNERLSPFRTKKWAQNVDRPFMPNGRNRAAAGSGVGWLVGSVLQSRSARRHLLFVPLHCASLNYERISLRRLTGGSEGMKFPLSDTRPMGTDHQRAGSLGRRFSFTFSLREGGSEGGHSKTSTTIHSLPFSITS